MIYSDKRIAIVKTEKPSLVKSPISMIKSAINHAVDQVLNGFQMSGWPAERVTFTVEVTPSAPILTPSRALWGGSGFTIFESEKTGYTVRVEGVASKE